jgi:hypothetical protein
VEKNYQHGKVEGNKGKGEVLVYATKVANLFMDDSIPIGDACKKWCHGFLTQTPTKPGSDQYDPSDPTLVHLFDLLSSSSHNAKSLPNDLANWIVRDNGCPVRTRHVGQASLSTNPVCL